MLVINIVHNIYLVLNGNQRKLLRATNFDVKLLNYVNATRRMNQEKTLTKEFFIVHHIFFFDRCSHNF